MYNFGPPTSVQKRHRLGIKISKHHKWPKRLLFKDQKRSKRRLPAQKIKALGMKKERKCKKRRYHTQKEEEGGEREARRRRGKEPRTAPHTHLLIDKDSLLSSLEKN